MDTSNVGSAVFLVIMYGGLVVYAVLASLRSGKALVKNVTHQITKLVESYPTMFTKLGIKKAPMATMISPNLVERVVWGKIPRELRGSEPLLMISPDFIIHTQKHAHFSEQFIYANKQIFRLNQRELSIMCLERSTVAYSFLHGIKFMSEKLGINNSPILKRIENDLGQFKEISGNGNYSLMIQSSGHDYIVTPFYNVKKLREQLKMICLVLKLNYDELSLGKYESGSSTFVGAGSWGMIGLGAALSIGSAINSSTKNNAVEDASMYVAYNNIAAIFNERYFPAEYAAWIDDLSVDGNYLSQKI
jgi:hypothetical protein